MIFRYYVFPYYFVILGMATFNFSLILVLCSGTLGALGWLTACQWVYRLTDSLLDWEDIPSNPTVEEFLEVYLSPHFVGAGTRVQKALILAVVAILIAVVMYRARQTVKRQLIAERDVENVTQVFGKFAPKVVADSMVRDSGALDPVEREAALLFVDLQGFTTMTEKKAAVGIVEILNSWFDRATEVINEHEGVVTQFQGDAILAIFNLPHDDPNHAENAYKAALGLLALTESNKFAGERLNCRIGFNTGHMIA